MSLLTPKEIGENNVSGNLKKISSSPTAWWTVWTTMMCWACRERRDPQWIFSVLYALASADFVDTSSQSDWGVCHPWWCHHPNRQVLCSLQGKGHSPATQSLCYWQQEGSNPGLWTIHCNNNHNHNHYYNKDIFVKESSPGSSFSEGCNSKRRFGTFFGNQCN
jgi:hypothetical protein